MSLHIARRSDPAIKSKVYNQEWHAKDAIWDLMCVIYGWHNFVLFFSAHLASSDDHEHRLIRDVMRNYDLRVRPSMNASQALNVTFGLALAQIIDVVRFWIHPSVEIQLSADSAFPLRGSGCRAVIALLAHKMQTRRCFASRGSDAGTITPIRGLFPTLYCSSLGGMKSGRSTSQPPLLSFALFPPDSVDFLR